MSCLYIIVLCIYKYIYTLQKLHNYFFKAFICKMSPVMNLP